MKKNYTLSEQATKKLAQDLAKKLKGGDILALVGELGAGKTTFVQGLAGYFGIKKHVSSPTFTLIQEYEVKNSKLKTLNSSQIQNNVKRHPKQVYPEPAAGSHKVRAAHMRGRSLDSARDDSYKSIQKLIHIDCYRLNNSRQLLDIGFEDYLDREDSVVIIEWAEKVKKILSKETKWIYFEHGKEDEERVIKIDK